MVNRVVEHFLTGEWLSFLIPKKTIPRKSAAPRTAKNLTEAAIEQKAIFMIIKDVSWLWRTAYNCAVQGCSEWADSDEQVSELFDISRQVCSLVFRSVAPFRKKRHCAD